ncbi:DUF4192 family protein [Micrococcus endophyticus]
MEPAASLDVPVLPARGPEDLLAYAGHALGRLPAGSLLLITLAAGRLRAVVRVDLPEPSAAPAPPDPAEAVEWARAVAGVCRRDAEADAVLALALPAGPAPGLDAPSCAAALTAALAVAGRPLAGAWTAAGGRARPWSGRDRGQDHDVDPRSAPLSLHLMARGSVWDRAAAPEPVPRAGPVPRGRRAASWRAPAADDDAARRLWLSQWEPVLAGERGAARPVPAEGTAPVSGPEEHPSADAAVLGAPLTLPSWRDALVLHAAVRPGVPPPEPAERERLLTAGSEQAPPWERLDRLRAGLRRLVPDAPPPAAAQALALAGWVGWARGQGSDAAAHLAAAAELAPDDPFVTLMRRVVDTGCVAGWAAHPDTAWRPGA